MGKFDGRVAIITGGGKGGGIGYGLSTAGTPRSWTTPRRSWSGSTA